MSATASPPPSTPDLALILANIARAQEETAKFAAEQRKLTAEAIKLQAEALKLERDRSLSPWLAGGAVAGGIVTVATLLLRALGVLS